MIDWKKEAKYWGRAIFLAAIIALYTFALGYIFARGFGEGLVDEHVVLTDNEQSWLVVPMTGIVEQEKSE